MKVIVKSAGIILRDGKILVTRTKGKEVFINPGGKLEPGETPEAALVRELREELGIKVDESDMQHIGEWSAVAAYDNEAVVRIIAFLVTKYKGEIARKMR